MVGEIYKRYVPHDCTHTKNYDESYEYTYTLLIVVISRHIS